MATDASRREHNPLVARVDALLRRHQETQRVADAEVPVLTEIVDAGGGRGGAGGLDRETLEALAGALEQAVLERLTPELQRTLDDCLARALPELVAEVTRASHERIAAGMQTLVREALADALADALGASRVDDALGASRVDALGAPAPDDASPSRRD